MRRNLWGTGVYSDDSDVVAMLAHTGWIKIRMGASKRKNLLVILRVLPRLQRYLATLRNGIRSREWSKHDGQSLRVEAVLESTNSELLSVVAKIKKRAKSDKSGANGSSGEDAVDGMDEDWVYGGHGFDEYGRSIYPSGFNPMDYVGHDIRFTDDNIAALIYDPLYFAYPSTKTAKRAEKAESPHATPPAAEDAMDIDSTTDDANENMVLQQLQLGQCLVIQTKEARYFLSIKSGSKLIIVRNESLKTTVSSQAELDAMIESATSTKDITEIEWDDVDWRMDGPYGRALDTRLVLAQSQLVFWCKMIR
ncbi:hypothetical protein GQ42DRAFT_153115 [Ramicandelaber brevisporus]|nr:hypothetical protein GQ42DRAFT_153115 [Ramicandelaber brevisporus]